MEVEPLVERVLPASSCAEQAVKVTSDMTSSMRVTISFFILFSPFLLI